VKNSLKYEPLSAKNGFIKHLVE